LYGSTNRVEDDRVTSTPDLAALETAVLQALVDKDRSTLMALLDERFLITTAGWLAEPAGRDEWVQEALDRHLMHHFSIHSIEERDLDGVVVALVLSSQTVTWQGQRQTYRFRYTDVWRPRVRNGSLPLGMPRWFPRAPNGAVTWRCGAAPDHPRDGSSDGGTEPKQLVPCGAAPASIRTFT
jgi:hypothetical protein